MTNAHRLALCALLAFAAGIATATRLETSRLVVVRSEISSAAGQSSTTGYTMKLAGAQGVAAATPGTARVAMYPGALAPPADAAGVLTATRIGNQIVGAEPLLDPLATDFAGNGDGRIDVADLVDAVNEQRP